jgi:hypothetical protein
MRIAGIAEKILRKCLVIPKVLGFGYVVGFIHIRGGPRPVQKKHAKYQRNFQPHSPPG